MREGKFEEAAKCHEEVADLLTEAYKQLIATLFPHGKSYDELRMLCASFKLLKCIDSIILQKDYHRRQAAVVRYVISQILYRFTLQLHITLCYRNIFFFLE